MADYQLIKNRADAVLRTTDQATVPNDERNLDWLAYQQWIAEGGTPDPAPEDE